MKVYKNQNEYNAKELGFYSNFSFASDEIMSPNGIDIIECKDVTKSPEVLTYEVTEYDKETKTARITIYSKKEYEQYRKSLAKRITI